MHAEPLARSPAVSELLAGEGFCVVDASGAWAWGFATADHYVGYVPVDALGPPATATHIVAMPAALLFERPDIKSPLAARLPMGARLVAIDEDRGFVRTARGFVHGRHVAPLAEPAADPVAVAERLVGTPYLWGGRSGDGIDCSGLVQLALAFAGIAAPRDSDQQRALGRAIGADEPPARGDLLFWPGHVGLLADATTLLHANAHWMAVTREPLADVIARAAPGAGIVARRRL